jgi:NADH-quinone oxidoreductase subunit B
VSTPVQELPNAGSVDMLAAGVRSGIEVPEELKRNILVAPFEKLANWGRKNSLWPFGFGLSCCFIEFISMAAGKFDVARFGSEVIRPSPRQADVMIVAGTLTKKMAPAVVRLYHQMAEPRYVIAQGNCTVSGGIFTGAYSVVEGIDSILPVDVYVPGCPPRPDALIYSIIQLQRKIDRDRPLSRQSRHSYRDAAARP